MSRAIVRTAASMAILAAAAGCNTDNDKATHARQEIGIQSQILMNALEIPIDQADYDKKTAVAGCPADPWGNPYVYERLAVRRIKISSKGKDGKTGTPDDIAEEFTFPSGSGLGAWTVTREDGVKALKSPELTHTFWTTQKQTDGNQTTEWWIGDAKGVAAKPFKSDTTNDDWRRSVTMMRWTKDGKFVEAKDTVTPTRPDGSSTKQTIVYIDAAAGKMVEASAVPSDEAAWMEY